MNRPPLPLGQPATSLGAPHGRHAESRPLSRRQFVQTSLAGSLAGALGAWAPQASAAPGPRARPLPLHAAVCDGRFAAAERFANVARGQQLPIRALRGDVTDLWYHELHPLWSERPAPIAGLTAYAALFCLEELARDHRMRVIYRALHRPLSTGEVEHLVALPGEVSMGVAPHWSADWPAEVAAMIARVEHRSGWAGLAPAPRAMELRCVTPAAPRTTSSPEITLYSWVIAPPARA
jgi:hypothetical protein